MCKAPVDEVVAAAVDAGVERMVTVGTTPERSRAAVAVANGFDEVWCAVGHHPNSAGSFDLDALAVLRDLAVDDRCVAIGETGLDYYRDYAPRADQERAFLAQIELAREVGKPVVIHTRAAEEDTIAFLLAHARGVKVILHCFTMASRLDECLAQPDWWFSFAGNMTYPSAPELREAAVRIPADRLLVETDAPYLSPVPLRGKPNEPANVVHTAQALALERRVSYEELEASVAAAAASVFGW
jgi:TatD DNase family protein